MINRPLGDCKTADLNLADRIQAGGVLVVADAADGRIRAVSANSAELLGREPAMLLGKDWRQARDPILAMANVAGPIAGIRVDVVELAGRSLQVAHHFSGPHLIFELMPAPHRQDALEREAEAAELSRSIAEFSAIDDEVEAAAALMRAIARVTAHHRVMVYRFLPDWHGEVVAETLAPGVESFLGLRFPAGDIPPNARRLYLVKRQRIIADVRAESVPVVAEEAGLGVDLTWSELRAVHPVHIQYLENMGVEASFSVSIVVAGRLWGLVACHHFEPRALTFRRRRLCEQLAAVASMRILALRQVARQAARHVHDAVRATIANALDEVNEMSVVLPAQLSRLQQAFEADAVIACLGEHEHSMGALPSETGLGALRDWLDGLDPAAMAARDSVPPELANRADVVRHASGLMYLPLTGRDFVLLLRGELAEQVLWAGRPPSEGESHAAEALGPRTSFATWKEQMQGRSRPWTDAELEAGAALHSLLSSAVERAQLQRLALSDPLTGLHNREMFRRRLQETVESSVRDQRTAAVLMIDLDRFKPVNDEFGHAAGDELLLQIAQRLKAHVREGDLVARLGGDEFGVIQPRVADEAAVHAAAARLLEALRAPYQVLGNRVEIGASVGAALCPTHAAEVDELVNFADIALYGVKQAGRDGFAMFDPRSSVGARGEGALGGEFGRALVARSLHLVFQPVVDLRDGRPQAIECYARWQHASRGTFGGHALVALASRHGLEAEFAWWGISAAASQARALRRLGFAHLPLAVNISASQFTGVDLAGFCRALSDEIGFGLEWLRLDVDQSVLSHDIGLVGQRIAALDALGVRIALDHFGEGSIHLAGLAGAALHRLKVRASVLYRKQTQPLGSILSAIAESLRVPLVATHVEAESGLDALRARGIVLAQGYAVAPVLDADSLARWLEANVAGQVSAAG